MKVFKGLKYLVMGVGLYKVGEVGYTLGNEVYLRNFKERQPIIETYGECYALVTDSEGDLGYAYADQLAQRRFNLILISKNGEELQRQKEDFETQRGVKVKTVEFDFNKPQNADQLNNVYNELRGLDIGVLVNNLETYQIQRFDHIYPHEIEKSINSGVLSTTLLLNAFIPQMLQREKRSCIINVGSELGDFPAGYMSLFSATKAFNNTLSRALQQEFGDRIDVVTALPGPLDTARYQRLFENRDTEASFLTGLYQRFLNRLTLSNPIASADATLNVVDEKTEIPGTAKHLFYYLGHKISSIYPWRASSFQSLYDVFGEKRLSNVDPFPPVQVEKVVPIEPEVPLPPKVEPIEIIRYVEAEPVVIVQEKEVIRYVPVKETPDISGDIVKTLSNDFLVPFIAQDHVYNKSA